MLKIETQMGKYQPGLGEYTFLIHSRYRRQDCEEKKILVMNRISLLLA